MTQKHGGPSFPAPCRRAPVLWNRIVVHRYIHIYKYICKWHDSSMYVTWLVHVRDMTHACVWHDSCMHVTWLMYVCDMKCACMWHDSCMTHVCLWKDWCMHVTWLLCQGEGEWNELCMYVASVLYVSHTYVIQAWHEIHMGHICMWLYVTWHRVIYVCGSMSRDIGLYMYVAWVIYVFDVRLELRMCVTWLMHVRDTTHVCVWHDSYIYVTWLIWQGEGIWIVLAWYMYVCDMTHAWMWHTSFVYVTWLMYVCDVTHSYVWHDSFICVTWLIHMCDVTHSYVWHDSFICVTWLTWQGEGIWIVRLKDGQEHL